MTYLERIAQRKAAYVALVPPPPPEPITPPKINYSILPFKLSPGKRDYYILATEHGSTLATHLLHIHQCGNVMQYTRHIFSLYDIPPNAVHLQDITSELIYANSYERKERKPLVTGFSLPVVFHAYGDITIEAQRIIKTNLE